MLAMDWSVNQKREAIAQFGTLVAALVVMVLMQTMVIHQDAPAREDLIQLSILTSPDVPQPIIVPPLQKIQPPEPERVVEQIQPEQVVPVIEPPAPVNVQEAVATPVQTVTEKMAAPVQPVAGPQRQVMNTAGAEAQYISKVKSYLISVKRYPTGREASLTRPAGKTRIWFVLRRSGELVDAGIEASSGSMLLDSSALSTVRRANYTAFPEESWAGQSQHQFSVDLDFVPPSS
jgi:protein TonB